MMMLTLLAFAFLVLAERSLGSPNYFAVKLNKENPMDPGACNESLHGDTKLVRDRLGEDRLIICSSKIELIAKNQSRSYFWKAVDGGSTLGEYFDPALDCTDVVDRVPGATNGYYWIFLKDVIDLVKVWCDIITDGGGFMLVAKQDDSVTWNVPSSNKAVDPFGKPHWSSRLGNIKLLDIRFQFSTTSEFKDTKAHWCFRLSNKRRFGELMIRNRGGCTEHNPGIGDIKFVKDLQVGKIVNTHFRCSLFSGHVSSLIGWGMMNKCLQKSCDGFAFLPGMPEWRLDDSGSFSYSAKDNSTSSGIVYSSTAFIGCSHKKCCACYGPKGGTDNYCLKNCTAINGGKVTKHVKAWVWIRTSLPKRVWRKCIDFTTIGPDGKEEKYKVDEETGLKEKGSCGTSKEVKNSGGVLLVPDKDALKKIPPVQGLLAFRPKTQQLLVQGQQGWNQIAMEKEVQGGQQLILEKQKTFVNQINSEKQKLEENQRSMKNKQQTLERDQNNIKNTQQNLEKKQQTWEKQQQTFQQQLVNKMHQMEQQIEAMDKKFTALDGWLKNCKEFYENAPNMPNGYYKFRTHEAYCDVVNKGWTLTARFSNSDYKHWISNGNFWYDRTTEHGITRSPSHNGDMISSAFWQVAGNEFKITRSDDSSHTALLQTTSNCLKGRTFRSKITSYGNFRNGAVWASNLCNGSCPVSYGGRYKSTEGFQEHSCSSDIQSSNYIGFWCGWIGDGAVMMIGGGGDDCKKADHGIGITQYGAAKFRSHSYFGDDFGHAADHNQRSLYSLNLWVR